MTTETHPLQALDESEREGATESAMPTWTDPMLATLTHDPFDDPEWIYERKLDGERVLAFVDDDGAVQLLSRNRKRLNDSYPEIEEALAIHAPSGCVLDGEVVAFDAHGVSDFQRLQPRMQSSGREEAEASDVAVSYYVFDCTYVDGHDLSGCTQQVRKKVLRAAIDWNDPLRFTPHRRHDGLAYYHEACEKGWEGVIAKRDDAPYAHGRSRNWLKFKCVLGQEFVIGGFTDPEGEREGFGALLVGFYRDGQLVHAGKVGTGYDDATLRSLGRRLRGIERETSPFDRGDPGSGDGIHFVTPELVAEVTFTAWTEDEKLRHPRFRGLRRDKDPGDVVREDHGRRPEGGS